MLRSAGRGLIEIIRDFRVFEVHGASKPVRKRTLLQDKGQARMVKASMNAVKESDGSLIPSIAVFAAKRAAVAVLESFRTRQAVSL